MHLWVTSASFKDRSHDHLLQAVFSLKTKQEHNNKTTKCYFCRYMSVCDVGYSAAGWKYRYIQIYTYCCYHLHSTKSLTTRRCFNLQQFRKLKFSFLINYWNEQIDITIMCFFRLLLLYVTKAAAPDKLCKIKMIVVLIKLLDKLVEIQ